MRILTFMKEDTIIMKKRIHLLVAAAVLLISLFAGSMIVSAAPTVVNDGNIDMKLIYHQQKEKNTPDYIIFEKTTYNTKVKKLKSSNTGVAQVSWSAKNPSVIHFDLKKTGSTKITGVLYEGKTKIKKFTINLNVYKYSNPAKTFSLNDKNFASKFTNTDTYTFKPGSTTKFKLKIKAKKGWKFEGVWYRNESTTKKIKNKKTFKMMSNWSYVDAVFTNKKTGAREDIAIIIDK